MYVPGTSQSKRPGCRGYPSTPVGGWWSAPTRGRPGSVGRRRATSGCRQGGGSTVRRFRLPLPPPGDHPARVESIHPLASRTAVADGWSIVACFSIRVADGSIKFWGLVVDRRERVYRVLIASSTSPRLCRALLPTVSTLATRRRHRWARIWPGTRVTGRPSSATAPPRRAASARAVQRMLKPSPLVAAVVGAEEGLGRAGVP